jgi:hypothetical protein
MKALYSITILVLLLSSCNVDEKKKAPSRTIGSEKDYKEKARNQDTTFYVFLEHFNNDTSFQLNRIDFPLCGKVVNLDSEGPETFDDTIYVNEYWIKDFTYDEKQPDKFDFTREIQVQGDEATIEVSGKETGLSVTYTFRKTKGKWMLVWFEDYST